ncbi:MAG: hypothetical protein K0R17_2742 [Rariglobus sp.]|jgi:hypothetical protein|nr:hypothetical protein [Rariglobus sp.]
MILAPGEFCTLTGDIWKGHLGVARGRQAGAAALRALAVSACTNASCPIRATCGRFGRSSQVSSTWPGGQGCNGFQPATLHSPKVA